MLPPQPRILIIVYDTVFWLENELNSLNLYIWKERPKYRTTAYLYNVSRFRFYIGLDSFLLNVILKGFNSTSKGFTALKEYTYVSEPLFAKSVMK